MDYSRLRGELHLTQPQFAALAGVTQPAVAAYERGLRRPSGRAAELYRVIERALSLPTLVVDLGRGRTATVPAVRWEHFLEPTGVVDLPVHLDWSPRQSPTWNVADIGVRAAFYSLILTEGSVVDVCVYLDPAEIARLSKRLRTTPAVAAVVDALMAVAV